MMASKGRTPPTPIDYTDYRVTIGGLPTGLLIKAENEQDARRQLTIGASRLGFESLRSSIELQEME